MTSFAVATRTSILIIMVMFCLNGQSCVAVVYTTYMEGTATADLPHCAQRLRGVRRDPQLMLLAEHNLIKAYTIHVMQAFIAI